MSFPGKTDTPFGKVGPLRCEILSIGGLVVISIWKSKQPFFTFRIIFSIMAIFFAVKSILNPLFNLNVVFMMFSLGLMFAVLGIEIFLTKKRKYFILTIITSIFIISVGIFNLWVYLNI